MEAGKSIRNVITQIKYPMGKESKEDSPEVQLENVFKELGIDLEIQTKVVSLLQPLKEMDDIHKAHYQHSIRVGLLARKIAQFLHLDEKALFFSGIFHDLGKQEIRAELLGKTDQWTLTDREEVKNHVLAGYRLLKGRFDFSAEIMLLHHKFQPDAYPSKLPSPMHQYSDDTKATIAYYGRILALADVYDAMHRKNSKFGAKGFLTDQEIEEKMLQENPDQRELVVQLYQAEIFTTK